MTESRGRRFINWIQKPSVMLSFFGLAGFLVDMLVKPITNAGLILLMVAAFPMLLRIVRRLKVGDYLEFEALTPVERDEKLENEVIELADHPGDLEDGAGEANAPALAPNEQPQGADEGAAGVQVPEIRNAPAANGPEAVNNPDLYVEHILPKNTKDLFFVETLVLDWLQARLRAPIQKYVRVGSRKLDAIVFTAPPTLVEITVLKGVSDIARKVDRQIQMLVLSGHEWRRLNGVEPILTIVGATYHSSESVEFRAMAKALSNQELKAARRVDTRLVSIPELQSELGMQSN